MLREILTTLVSPGTSVRRLTQGSAGDGSAQTLYPISGTYAISLPMATNRNMPGTTGGVAPDSTGSAPIGGSPRILVEYDPNAK